MIRKYVIGPWGRLFRRPAFVLGVILLGLSAAGMRAGAQWLQWNFRKEAVPLRKALDDLDQGKLGAYKVIRAIKLLPEIEEELGTKEYLNWLLEDTEVDLHDPTRHVQLFVAYYTGNPDKVPHIPDHCIVGSGGQVRNGQNQKIEVPDCGLGQEDDELPVRVLEIWLPPSSPGQNRKGIVTYFFSVNGEYRSMRSEVRLRLNNWRDRYAYFSKVEISFIGQGAISWEGVQGAVEKLCQTVVPILWSEHWPDWSSLPKR